ncbi:MAG: M48 family metallopeptidase [Dysgonamonadaceae bacterium]|jgi:predicted Zn-dependent protease|nr:M48 family metallopeptidase [Dysgonamonadaceae bacterium]
MTKRNIFKTAKFSFIVLFATLLFSSCGSTPFTGRRQLLLVSNQEVLALSLQQYNEFMSTASVIRGTPEAEMVNRVGSRIANAVATFYKSKGMESELQGFNWEFSLVRDPSVNAFAMPGGKIVIFEGLLPVTQTEEALAVVVGHEVAHVIAHHASERISRQMALQGVGNIGGALLGSSRGTQIGMTVFGLGAQYSMLPFSRQQEYEADEIGLIVMALAGYDPRAAVPFWTRMSQNSSGGNVPAFLSTHPTDANRIAHIEQIMPHVLEFYRGAGVQNQTPGRINTNVAVPSSNINTSNARTSSEWTF